MINPQHLHAAANLWSLAGIWPILADAAHTAAGASGDDRGTVQAWRPGSGVHSSRAGDAVLDAIIRNGACGANPYNERLNRTADTVAWLAAALLGPPTPATTLPALKALLAGLDRLRASAALHLAMWINVEDRAVRRLLGEPTDHVPLPGINCPRCDTGGALAMRSSSPRMLDRPVLCTVAGCMRDGVPSIWTQDQLAAELGPQAAAA